MDPTWAVLFHFSCAPKRPRPDFSIPGELAVCADLSCHARSPAGNWQDRRKASLRTGCHGPVMQRGYFPYLGENHTVKEQEYV